MPRYLTAFLEMMSELHPDDQQPSAPPDYEKSVKIEEAAEDIPDVETAHEEFVEANFGDMKHASAEL